MFATLLYSSPSKLTARGILRNLSSMYDGLLFTGPCVTLVYSELEAYSEPCQISMIDILFAILCNPSIFRTVVYSVQDLSRNILFKTLCNPDIFRTLSIFKTPVYCEIKAYSEPYQISEMEHFIKIPV